MTQLIDLQQILVRAIHHHQSGELAQAEPLYQQVLAALPNQPDALHLLGLLWHQTGRSSQALELMARSVQIAPTFASLNNLGDLLRALGRPQEAVACFNRSIEMEPKNASAFLNLALAMHDLGRPAEAEKCLTRATQLDPNRAEFFSRLCLLRSQIGDPHGAVLAGNRAVELAPHSAEAWSNLAVALASAKKHEQALQAAVRSMELGANQPQVVHNKGFVHERAGRTDDAVAAYKKALELDPNFGLAHRNLAAVYDGKDEVEESIRHLERALELQPNDIEGWTNLSGLRRRLRDHAGAVAAGDRAVQLNPANPNAHGNRGLALLALGDYIKGFADYEWRWRCDNFTSPVRDFLQPMWDGSDPAGRRIFVHGEQGYGDLIQFARYVPMLAARGAKVYLEAVVNLRPLMQCLKGVARVVPGGTKPPEYDLQIPLLSLPRIFGTTLDNIPADVPYFKIDEQRLGAWQERIRALGDGLKVGLVWAGNIKPDRSRTCPLANFAPLAGIKGIRFVSLQQRDVPHGTDTPPEGLNLTDVSKDLKDFAETAAAMMNLDLIVTIDTASAHLAGALGRKTWTMVPWAADWRWLSDRQDSPWYPTMRLFRQPVKGDWTPVIEQIAHELQKLV